MLNHQEQIQRGAAFLDERYPGWANQIDLDTLDLSNEWRCVLGQLYGHFVQGVQALGLPWKNVETYGFYPEREEREQLTEAWDEFIQARLGQEC